MGNDLQTKSNLKRSDRLLVQQHIARRFKAEYPEDFARLSSMRNELMDVLKQATGSCLRSDSRLLRAVAAWTTLVEYKEGRQALKESNRAVIRRILGLANFHPKWAEMESAAIKTMMRHIDTAERLRTHYNYFDHFSFLEMSSPCGGELLCRTLDAASSLRHPFETVGDTPAEYRIFAAPFVEFEEDLQYALIASKSPQRFRSETITVIDSRADVVTRADGDGGPALYLRIGLERAPADIDSGLRYLRSALHERLFEEHGFLPPGMSEYQETAFAKLPEPRAEIFSQIQMIKPAVLGLWCWDLVRDDGVSIAKATDAIEERRSRWNGERTPGQKSMEKHHGHAANCIQPGAGCGPIDLAVTGRNDVRLGRL